MTGRASLIGSAKNTTTAKLIRSSANGTSIRCSMTGNTTSDAYGNTVWASLSSHSSRLNSGYGTDWTETDFSYDLIDGRRTYVCHFIGTLEEPYKQSGFIEYYVYSEGWDIWFEAYST